MAACSTCGAESPPSARFCLACGAPLARVPVPVARKTVTVVFCDLADSTPLGERLDPEPLRRLLTRWYDAAREVLERHGGTVEKFIGDAVMAVFGIPVAHEDDALRAVHAAAELRRALDDLGAGLALRIGVNTGEVVAGDPAAGHTLVTGDTVNVAARLEQTAEPGEILIGPLTLRLVANAVVVDARGALPLKGKGEPVEAWSLRDVRADAPGYARRLDTPLVGRTAELARLRRELTTAVERRECRLATVIGPAGIGKSRLVHELAQGARDITVLGARCLAYGDGITFSPLTQLLDAAGGDEALRAALDDEEDGPLVLERLRAALDLPGASASSEEIFWGVRRLVETLGRTAPLLLCFEDIHWAQPTFLDLLEYLAGWTRDAPVLLVCLARPELIEDRPAWPGTAIVLEPLTRQEADALIDELVTDRPLPTGARARVSDAAEGNPLFVEQLVAMLAEDGASPGAVPPTIHALLAARLDRLVPTERAALERAAVFGREFTRGGVVALSAQGERVGVGSTLLALVRRELIAPDATSVRGDDGFRFRHALIRDAAYAGMPKELRAELHEQAADWLLEHGAVDELLAYHLEHAYRSRSELGLDDERTRGLGERAGELLSRAAHHAFLREDPRAAVSLFERADDMFELSPARRRERSAALWSTGRIDSATPLLAAAIAAAHASGDVVEEWLGVLEQAARRSVVEPERALEELQAVAEQAVHVFDELGHDAGRARAWRTISSTNRLHCRFAAAAHASELALGYARRAGAAREETWLVDELCTSLLYGPATADEAIERCEDLLRGATGRPLLEANVWISLAGLHGMRGEFERAWPLAASARAVYEEFGLKFAVAGLTQVTGPLGLLAGDTVRAERELREGYEILAGVGARGLQAAHLAHAVLARGDVEEAAVRIGEARRLSGGFDTVPQVLWRTAAAQLAIVDGTTTQAVAIAAEAVTIAAETDAPAMHADAELTHADALAAAGRPDDAAAAVSRALQLYEAKGHAVGVASALMRADALATSV